MPEWATFVGFAFVVTAGLLVLSHASRGVLSHGRDGDTRTDPSATSADPDSARSDPDGPDTESSDSDPRSRGDAGHDAAVPDPPGPGDSTGTVDGVDASEVTTAVDHTDTGAERSTAPKSGVVHRSSAPRARSQHSGGGSESLSTTSLLANVAASQGLFGMLLLVGAWYAEIPAWAFGAGPGTAGFPAIATGIGLGVALYIANEAGAAVGSRFGLDVGDGQRLRGALAPDTRLGWALLLLVVLPVIAGFEEVLFRGALVGVVAAGYDVSPWVLAVVASGAFALGHGAQGRLGVVVTGALGLVLAAAFVVTGSLLTVIVAHYLVNALEFVVHEGLGIEWPPDPA